MRPLTAFIGVLALFVFPSLASAEPVTLACRTSDGQAVADLHLDVENKTMRWGNGPLGNYTITNLTSDYITAYEVLYPGNVGGEVWVMHRGSGDYLRAGIGNACLNSSCDQTRVTASTYRGTCTRRQF